MPRNTDLSHGNWDIDLDFGKVGEQTLVDLLESDGSIEVKTERDEGNPKQWKTTGNIAIETSCNGKPSCISITKANHWIHALTDNGEFMGAFIFNVDKLRKKLKTMEKNGTLRVVQGGDNNASRLVLLPIKEAFSECLNERE